MNAAQWMQGKIRTTLLAGAAAAVLAASGTAQAGQPQSSAFTYQGQLTEAGSPVSGMFDFRFKLWDQEFGGGNLAQTAFTPIDVQAGLFTAEIDLGVSGFTNEARWLEIEFNGPDGLVTLPRQRLTATPYALQTRGMFIDGEGGMVLYGDDPNDELAGIRNDRGQLQLLSRGPSGTNVAASFERGEVMFFNDNGDENVVINNAGRVGIGTSNPQDELHVSGIVRAQAVRLTGGADIAEPFDVAYAGHVVPGMVVTIDPAVPGGLRVADSSYDAKVAGIISGAGGINAGMTLAQEGTLADGEHPVALTGRVWCLVDADANGAIEAGDMLTTSVTAGHAMKASDRDLAFGSTIGKAMTTLESGKGLVLVLVNLQ